MGALMYDAPDFVLNREHYLNAGALISARHIELRKLTAKVTAANDPVVVPAVWKLMNGASVFWSSPPIPTAAVDDILVFDLGELIVPPFTLITFDSDGQEVISNRPILEYAYVVNGD